MSPETWTQRVDAMLEAVLDRDPAEQEAILTRHRSTEPEVCAHVEGLLARARPGFLDCLAAVPPLEEWFPAEPAVAPGTHLADYDIEEEIGRGGMAVVYRARQMSLNRLVALKMILAGQFASPAEAARFRAEAEAVARLQHANIVQIHAIGEHDGLPFLALEYAAGGTLSDRLNGRPVPPREAARLTATLARAVHHAHERGVVHLDLKPANILLEKSEARNPKSEMDSEGANFEFRVSNYTPKVADFGLARKRDEEAPATQSGAIRGTPGYMAPEQANADHRRQVGPCSDVYALGAILYELLTGGPPFRAATVLETLEQVRTQEPVSPRRLQPKLARDLDTICLKCLEKDPARRYACAAELTDDLERWLAGRPVRARHVGLFGRGLRWCRRQPVVAGLAALVLLLFAGGFTASLVLWRRSVYHEARALAGEAEALANLGKEQAARQEAEDSVKLILQMITDSILVSNTPLLHAPEVSPVAVELLLKAEAWGTGLLGKREQDLGLRVSVADVRLRLGKFYLAHGQKAESLAWFEKAANLFEPLSPEGMHHLGYLSYAVSTRASLGWSHALAGDQGAARRFFDASLHLWQQLAKAPSNPAWREIAVGEGLLLAQALHETGHLEEDILGRFERLRSQPELLGGGPSYEQFLNLLRIKLACLRAEKTGPPEAALAAAREAAAILIRSHQDTSLDAGSRRWVALAMTELSVRLRQGGAAADALRLLEPAIRTLQDLVREAPHDAKLYVKLADAWEQVAKARWHLDQVAETLGAYRQALAAQRQACTLAPSVAEYRVGVGRLLLKLARKQCELGRLDDAEAALRERQALWPGDAAKHREALVELRKWAAQTAGEFSSEKRQEHQRYQDLITRLVARPPSQEIDR